MLTWKVEIVKEGRGFRARVGVGDGRTAQYSEFKADTPQEVAAHLDGFVETIEDQLKAPVKRTQASK